MGHYWYSECPSLRSTVKLDAPRGPLVSIQCRSGVYSSIQPAAFLCGADKRLRLLSVTPAAAPVTPSPSESPFSRNEPVHTGYTGLVLLLVAPLVVTQPKSLTSSSRP